MSHNHHHGIGSEHPHSHLIQNLTGILFFLIWILDSFLIKFAPLETELIPFLIRFLIFAACIGLGVFLGVKSHNLIFGGSEYNQAISKGVYSYVRHPMYLSFLVIYLGFIVLSFSIITFIFWLIIIYLFDQMAQYEEKDLERILKANYLEYKKNVPRWIPRKIL
ncbi:methyltransferase family protein [Candidatus Hodarchaeum mangrovi]